MPIHTHRVTEVTVLGARLTKTRELSTYRKSPLKGLFQVAPQQGEYPPYSQGTTSPSKHLLTHMTPATLHYQHALAHCKQKVLKIQFLHPTVPIQANSQDVNAAFPAAPKTVSALSLRLQETCLILCCLSLSDLPTGLAQPLQ